jgi:hypothetical protein
LPVLLILGKSGGAGKAKNHPLEMGVRWPILLFLLWHRDDRLRSGVLIRSDRTVPCVTPSARRRSRRSKSVSGWRSRDGRDGQPPEALPRDEAGVERGARGGVVFAYRVVAVVRREDGGAQHRERRGVAHPNRDDAANAQGRLQRARAGGRIRESAHLPRIEVGNINLRDAYRYS